MKTSTLKSLLVAVQRSNLFQPRKLSEIEIVPADLIEDDRIEDDHIENHKLFTTLTEKSLILREAEKRRPKRAKLEE